MSFVGKTAIGLNRIMNIISFSDNMKVEFNHHEIELMMLHGIDLEEIRRGALMVYQNAVEDNELRNLLNPKKVVAPPDPNREICLNCGNLYGVHVGNECNSDAPRRFIPSGKYEETTQCIN